MLILKIYDNCTNLKFVIVCLETEQVNVNQMIGVFLVKLIFIICAFTLWPLYFEWFGVL